MSAEQNGDGYIIEKKAELEVGQLVQFQQFMIRFAGMRPQGQNKIEISFNVRRGSGPSEPEYHSISCERDETWKLRLWDTSDEEPFILNITKVGLQSIEFMYEIRSRVKCR